MPSEVLRDEGSGHNIWSRRELFSVLGWGAVLGSIGASTLAFVRFMFPRVLFEPPTRWKAGFPTDYTVNTVSSRWMDDYRCWIVRWPDEIFSILAVCTHLGCTPRWLAGENKFKCPCHGSGYHMDGTNFEGPAAADGAHFHHAGGRRPAALRQGNDLPRRARPVAKAGRVREVPRVIPRAEDNQR
jgi:nitrite reductase/ring-hydroxylating ferredoxin subunit